MKRVLVTGASGFVGRHCLPMLVADGYQVEAVFSRVAPDDAPAEVRWHRVDLLASKDLPRLFATLQPTHLLHLAWYAEHGKYWTSPQNLRWVEASLELVQLFKEHGGQRVVLAGTCAEYSWKASCCSERTTPLEPATLYGSCKHQLQLKVDAYARETGLSAAWARLFFLYGPHEDARRLVAFVIRSLIEEQQTPCTHGGQIRDFLYIEDAASALVELLRSEIQGVINVASGKPVALKTLIGLIADKLDRRSLLQLAALSAQADDPPYLVADVSRLQNELGWKPRFDLDQGLDLTIAWWKRLHEQ
jgi:nucleoside-diphosphate-sugar epimerase